MPRKERRNYMKACTFFGQKDGPATLETAIRSAAEFLINERDVGIFYVGDSGRFDRQVRNALTKLGKTYPQIEWYIVPSKPEEKTSAQKVRPCDPVMRPAELASIPVRFADVFRNDWLIARSDFVIAYNPTRMGYAAQFIRKATVQGKDVLYLEEQSESM